MKVVRDLAGATAAFILMPVVIAGLGAALYVAVIRALVVEVWRVRR